MLPEKLLSPGLIENQVGKNFQEVPRQDIQASPVRTRSANTKLAAPDLVWLSRTATTSAWTWIGRKIMDFWALSGSFWGMVLLTFCRPGSVKGPNESAAGGS